MLQNKIVLLFLLVINFMFSQQKVDTVYVYEEIILHDTIYIEKKLDEIKIDNAVLTKEKNSDKLSIEVIQNGKKIKIKLDTIIGIDKKQFGDFSKKKSWFFGVNFILVLPKIAFLKV